MKPSGEKHQNQILANYSHGRWMVIWQVVSNPVTQAKLYQTACPKVNPAR